MSAKDTVIAKGTVDTTDSGSGTEGVLKEKEIGKEYGTDDFKGAARDTVCACTCDIGCNCKCTCRDHCVCRLSLCDKQCGTRVSRNLVVSIDGTSNQFGLYNTNVVELHSRVVPSGNQSKYYNCGIGTYVPYDVKMSFKYWWQRVDNLIDLAFAWNFKHIILEAYRWLSRTYQPGDKIFFFGFSRGAYQVRALAGMIETVGLVHAGNEALIPLSVPITLDANKIAPNFKRTFSWDVQVHFVGVWDTVSSVGVVRGQPLPLTWSANHMCAFRHALALDERRVKFQPEYIHGGSFKDPDPNKPSNPNVKEVWFAGTHSDIGGGIKENPTLDLSSVPLLWMENEAVSAGLRLLPRKEAGVWDMKKLDAFPSLTRGWWPLEYMHLTRLSYKDSTDVTTTPNYGAGRIIVPGQRIHITVAFKNADYRPQATFREHGTGVESWKSFVGKDTETADFDWTRQFENLVEMNLFDASFTFEAVQKLKNI
ncbi:hypothetical protein DFH09DRAFT_909378, partial [Mycena vulgaris]